VLTGGGGRSTAAGDLCIVGGVLSASLYSVVVKRFADDGDALSLTTLAVHCGDGGGASGRHGALGRPS
jgi:drug/metabolite transporter (DMT)-like permease